VGTPLVKERVEMLKRGRGIDVGLRHFFVLKDQISVFQAYQNVINPALIRRILIPMVRNDFELRES
jgi:hypothetical protein